MSDTSAYKDIEMLNKIKNKKPEKICINCKHSAKDGDYENNHCKHPDMAQKSIDSANGNITNINPLSMFTNATGKCIYFEK